MNAKLLGALAIALVLTSLPVSASIQADERTAQESAIADVFGRIIYVGGGSTNYQQISPLVLRPYSRRNIELGYALAFRFRSDKGISLAGDNEFVVNIKYVMIDCINKTYSPYPEDETNMGMIAYRSGSDFKWGDYERLGFDSHESVTGPISKLFEDACTLSEKF